MSGDNAPGESAQTAAVEVTEADVAAANQWSVHPELVPHLAKSFAAHRIAHEKAAVEQATKELRKAIRDMYDAADDLGIHPQAIVYPDGKRVERTERQSGYNDAVMQLGGAFEVIAGRIGIDTEEGSRITKPWCWAEPLAALRKENEHQTAAIEAARVALEEFIEAINTHKVHVSNRYLLAQAGIALAALNAAVKGDA